jgi:hypothetical protein
MIRAKSAERASARQRILVTTAEIRSATHHSLPDSSTPFKSGGRMTPQLQTQRTIVGLKARPTELKRTNVRVFELAPPATETPLLSDMTPEARKGISIMKVEDMVGVAIRGIETDRLEIRPGQSNQLKLMNRIAPGFIHKMLAKPVDGMLDQ